MLKKETEVVIRGLLASDKSVAPEDIEKAIAYLQGRRDEDEVMNHLLEHGGVELLMAGAEAIGKDRAKTPKMVKAAARAVAFYVDPDNAIMFPEE